MHLPGKRAVPTVVLCGLVLLATLRAAFAVAGDDFRIDSKVFYGDQQEPTSQSTTIFHDGVVYDYLQQPAEVFIFEQARDRLVLLDTTRRLYTEVPVQKVATFTEQLKQRAAGQADPLMKFLANPTFDEQFDAATGALSFTSPWMTYRVLAMDVPDPAVARRYREFSDWYVRLSPMLDPAARPPFARMLVNAALDRRGLLPREVTLSLDPKAGITPKRITIRSQHQLVSRLGEPDLNRVAQTRQLMVIFSPVNIEQYAKLVR